MEPDKRLKLSLFISSRVSAEALAQLYEALSVIAYTRYELELIDVEENKPRAEAAGITKVPTLVYHSPNGDKRTDELTDCTHIRALLGLTSR